MSLGDDHVDVPHPSCLVQQGQPELGDEALPPAVPSQDPAELPDVGPAGPRVPDHMADDPAGLLLDDDVDQPFLHAC